MNCPSCGLELDDLNVVQTQTTDSLRALWRDHRFSKQAKDFLAFLIEKNIDGKQYSKPHNNLEPYDDFPYETKYVGSKEVNGKWIRGVETNFYSKAISLISYLNANRDKFPDINLRVLICSGNLYTSDSSTRNSLNRTILRLWKWGLLLRYYFPDKCQAKHYYFISEKGRRVFHAKCCTRRVQHLEQSSTALMVRQ